jgi:hypothetical protein
MLKLSVTVPCLFSLIVVEIFCDPELVPCGLRNVIAVSDLHVVDSHTVCPARAIPLISNVPKSVPLMDMLKDPVAGEFRVIKCARCANNFASFAMPWKVVMKPPEGTTATAAAGRTGEAVMTAPEATVAIKSTPIASLAVTQESKFPVILPGAPLHKHDGDDATREGAMLYALP